MIYHAKRIGREAVVDGELDAVVLLIPDTGDSSVIPDERYTKRIVHGLGRIPVGCMVQMSNKDCRVVVRGKDINWIDVQFTAEHAELHLRIW